MSNEWSNVRGLTVEGMIVLSIETLYKIQQSTEKVKQSLEFGVWRLHMSVMSTSCDSIPLLWLNPYEAESLMMPESSEWTGSSCDA
jgi:hypothetical protein